MKALVSDRKDATLKDIPARDPEVVTPRDQAMVDAMQQGMDWGGILPTFFLKGKMSRMYIL